MCPPGPAPSGRALCRTGRNDAGDFLLHGDATATAGLASGSTAFGLRLRGAAALEQMCGDARIGCRFRLAAGSCTGVGSRSRRSGFCLCLLASLLSPLEEMLWNLSHASPRSHVRRSHSGPLIPPSLRTRQKWMAMKMTMTNGNIKT